MVPQNCFDLLVFSTDSW